MNRSLSDHSTNIYKTTYNRMYNFLFCGQTGACCGQTGACCRSLSSIFSLIIFWQDVCTAPCCRTGYSSYIIIGLRVLTRRYQFWGCSVFNESRNTKRCVRLHWNTGPIIHQVVQIHKKQTSSGYSVRFPIGTPVLKVSENSNTHLDLLIRRWPTDVSFNSH
jgi:hypothetical protein